jgi:hypothetical protein
VIHGHEDEFHRWLVLFEFAAGLEGIPVPYVDVEYDDVRLLRLGSFQK